MLPSNKNANNHLLPEHLQCLEEQKLVSSSKNGVIFETELKNSATQAMENLSLMDKIHPSMRTLRYLMAK